MATRAVAKAGVSLEAEVAGIPDFDPEHDGRVPAGVSSGDESGEDEDAGTEHYVAVDKSALRQKQTVVLGPEYRGSKISREALIDGGQDGARRRWDLDEAIESQAEDNDTDSQGTGDGYDDLSGVELQLDSDCDDDEEIDSDAAFGDGDEAKFKKFEFSGSSKSSSRVGHKSRRPVAADFLTPSGEDEEDEEDEEDAEHLGSKDGDSNSAVDKDEVASQSEDEEMSDFDDTASDDSADHSDDEENSDNSTPANGRTKLHANGTKSEILLRAANHDVEKGRAIRQQRKTFDSLLNLRIRLQKALVAANSFSAAPEGPKVDEEPYKAAEEAALKLLSTLDNIRDGTSEPGKSAGVSKSQRKRTLDIGQSNEEIWGTLQSVEKAALAKRRKTVDTWSARLGTLPPEMLAPVRQLGPRTAPRSMTSNLDDQLQNVDRLVKRTQRPRSCAPLQAALTMQEDKRIYDDADFYQLLLKDLVDQRAVDPSAAGVGAVTTVSWTAIKEARTRKDVDRKASKGRKMRFNVHEKLQNFMAPEDRRSWEDEAIDRLFQGLFGNKTVAASAEERSDKDTEAPDIGGPGIRLFGS